MLTMDQIDEVICGDRLAPQLEVAPKELRTELAWLWVLATDYYRTEELHDPDPPAMSDHSVEAHSWHLLRWRTMRVLARHYEL